MRLSLISFFAVKRESLSQLLMLWYSYLLYCTAVHGSLTKDFEERNPEWEKETGSSAVRYVGDVGVAFAVGVNGDGSSMYDDGDDDVSDWWRGVKV